MIALRLVVFLVLLGIGVSLVVYLFSGNRRYLQFAGRLFKLSLLFLAVAAVLFVLERLILV